MTLQVVLQPARTIGDDLLDDARRHAAWVREDMAAGDIRTAMSNIVAANRLHAMAPSITPEWETVGDELRAVQVAFWDLVKP